MAGYIDASGNIKVPVSGGTVSIKKTLNGTITVSKGGLTVVQDVTKITGTINLGGISFSSGSSGTGSVTFRDGIASATVGFNTSSGAVSTVAAAPRQGCFLMMSPGVALPCCGCSAADVHIANCIRLVCETSVLCLPTTRQSALFQHNFLSCICRLLYARIRVLNDSIPSGPLPSYRQEN